MPTAIPIIPGERYGRLTIEGDGRGPDGRRLAVCKCDCGETVSLPMRSMTKGNTSSCGCLRREMVAAKNNKHGLRKRSGGSPAEYFIWKQMRNRCNNPEDPHADRYSERGITVCRRWDDYTAFAEDMGPRPSPKHSIDRKDNDLGYWCGKPDCPECGSADRKPNCRWATASQQARNKRNNVRVEVDGATYTLADLAEKHGIDYGRLASRIRSGWEIKRALTEPIQMGKNQYGSR